MKRNNNSKNIVVPKKKSRANMKKKKIPFRDIYVCISLLRNIVYIILYYTTYLLQTRLREENNHVECGYRPVKAHVHEYVCTENMTSFVAVFVRLADGDLCRSKQKIRF